MTGWQHLQDIFEPVGGDPGYPNNLLLNHSIKCICITPGVYLIADVSDVWIGGGL
jgi:hypothetical protein